MVSLDVWQCDCGNIEHGEFPPEECEKCWKRNSFAEVPEEMKEELENLIIEEMRPESGD